ncbi:hypothetical protein TPHA_0K01370 [Tetrapisispora phaffii CBS 4417]|uniref:Uncharacterized protein n=1 Tax=Tetrapisispora phaffii (strain ATCC 24235 / CBS 4417 / NBRC 1672 / NRRL Y-8282 / UCD 70-5) TaxID=1071381 RepID=G8BZE2_TETPH|nr:hypothetical protein TPHA_0K01370 [Tetrapisispora phaffii CBS 4417]CCE65270.1 hypothetical protein TPHA_0K01370 [Tetrapisispora phaffii CBS 4417]
MSRLRKINRALLGIGYDNEVGDIPLDIDEQEELINKLEIINYDNNKQYINFLTILNLIICGIYIFLIKKYSNRLIKIIFVLSLQSMLLSLIILRYNIIIKDLPMINKFKFKFNINNNKLNILNIIIIITINWLFYSNYKEISSVADKTNKNTSVLLHIFIFLPSLQYIISNLTIYWIKLLNNDITDLRTLKYKYKSA